MLTEAWPWLALILLGAWHGLNPGMGWLFSVVLGLQHRSRRAVFGALAPIALGHALAIGMVVLLVYEVGAVIPFRWLQIGGAATLFIVACWKLWRALHPTWLGMRRFLGSDPLVLAHGECAWSRPHGRAGPSRSEIDFLRNSSIQRKLASLLQPLVATAAVGIHTISHLVVSGLVAWIVYDFIGLAVLRRSWINLDLIWCFSLLAAAIVLFFAPIA